MSRDMFWNPPVELTSAEQKIIKRCKAHRKLFVFLRQTRHLLLDDEFQNELHEMYRQTGAGKPPLPPAQLALLTILQKYANVADKEAIELTVDSRRWQMVLDCLGEDDPLTSSSVLYDFRMRLMATDMDQRLLERTVEFARETGGFSAKTLRLAFDSSPLEGHGRVEDTFNMLAHAAQKAIVCVSHLAQMTVEEVREQAGLELFGGRSIKSELDIDWSNSKAKQQAMTRLYCELEALDDWLCERFPKQSKEGPLRGALETLNTLIVQDLEPSAESIVKLRNGVAKNRQISVEDGEMRHGRKSKKKRFDGYKRHIGMDLDERLILSAEVTAGNQSDADAVEALLEGVKGFDRKLISLHVDRQYLHSPQVLELEQKGVNLLCKSPGVGNKNGLWSKREFDFDMKKREVKCPAGISVPFTLGKIIEFPARSCDGCRMREQCTKRAQGKGRTIHVHEKEELFQSLGQREKSSEGRAELRARVGVEHGLAHVSQRQGNQARYNGTRKNLFDLRLVCAIQNLERAQMIACSQ